MLIPKIKMKIRNVMVKLVYSYAQPLTLLLDAWLFEFDTNFFFYFFGGTLVSYSFLFLLYQSHQSNFPTCFGFISASSKLKMIVGIVIMTAVAALVLSCVWRQKG